MKKIYTLLCAITLFAGAQAQSKIDTKKLKQRANDHFMLQFTGDTWAGKPDSITTKGIGRGGNVYFMMDYPFKSSPNFSAAIGAGFGTSSIYFKKMGLDIKGKTQNVVFKNLEDTSRFKKFKLATAFLEVPVEIRWIQKPGNSDHSFKVALGVKVGTLLSASTKGKELEDLNSNALNKYTEKIKNNKTYFNSSRIALTARIGYGHFSAFGQYQVTGVFKDNIAPVVRPFSIGIALSGL